MSPREFDGAVPQEVHEHFDADGVLTGYTVVTRESLWDDDSRGRAMRLAEYEQDVCSCGQPVEVCQDQNRVMGVGKRVCMSERAIRIKRRNDEAEHKGDTPHPQRGLWSDGLHYYAVPQTK